MSAANDHLTHVRIRDFQSIADADFEPGPLTVVVGDNDAGKTAIMRAIRAACFNETGSATIRRGEERSQVTLEFADATWVRWTKKRDGGATYELTTLDANGERHAEDTQKFSKLGAAVPPEVQDALRISEIEVAKDWRIQPQFHPQEEYYFLLDRPEGQAARALAKMTKLDVVVEAQQAIRSDLKRAKQELVAAELSIESLTEDLKVYDGLLDDVAACERCETAIATAMAAGEKIDSMRAAWDEWCDLEAEMAPLGDIPGADAIAALKTRYNEVRAMTQAWRDFENAAEQRAGSTVPTMPDLMGQYDILYDQCRASLDYAEAVWQREHIAEELATHDDTAAKDIERWNALKVCPECGQPLGDA